MTLTRGMMRNAGKKAYAELKKRKFYESKSEGSLTTLSLFGDAYKFHFDSDRKLVWCESKHHYIESNNFTLATKHKNWAGIFSLAGQVAAQVMSDALKLEGIEVIGQDNTIFRREVGIVVNQAYRLKKDGMARVFGGILWKHLDKEIASLALRSFGFSAGSLDYSIVANNKEEIVDTLNKSPGILPVWRNLILIDMYQNRKETDAPRKKNRNFSHLFNGEDGFLEEMPLNHPAAILSRFNYPKLVTNYIFPDIIKTVKENLEKLGLTSVGWRYLSKMKPRAVSLFLHSDSVKSFVKMINWFAAIGVFPRYSLIKPLLNSLSCQDTNRTEDLTALMRAAFTYANKMRSGVRNFYADQLSLVIDWFSRSGERHKHVVASDFIRDHDLRGFYGNRDPYGYGNQVQLDHNQRKASWDWFMRQQVAWHREQIEREKAKIKNQSWESAISELVVKVYKIVPLTSAYELIEEGKDMHHCVGSYAQNCMDGESRIFSIRDMKDKKIATLELRYHREKWAVGQCRSSCNKKVSKEVESVAEIIAKKYNKIYEEKGAIAV
jgi:hypothetical protein